MDSIAIGVLGMHRSGTSAITRALNLMGVELGPSLMPATKDNPDGFWENVSIVNAHQRLLAALNRKWHDTEPFPAVWRADPHVVAFKEQLRQIIRKEFGDARLWGWKDPRSSLFLPIWTSLLQELGAEPRFLLVVRNPLEVAASLGRRDGFNAKKSFILWFQYTASALLATRGFRATMIHYEAFLGNWQQTLITAADRLGLSDPRDPDAFVAEMKALVKPGYRHHVHSIDGARVELPTPVYELYDILIHCDSWPQADDIARIEKLYARYEKAFDFFVLPDAVSVPVDAELFWADKGGFSQDRSVKRRIIPGSNAFEYSFDVEATQFGANEGLTLRFDPVNHPSLVCIEHMEIAPVEAAADAGDFPSSPISVMDELQKAPLQDALRIVSEKEVRLLVYGDDPQIILTTPASIGPQVVLRTRMSVQPAPVNSFTDAADEALSSALLQLASLQEDLRDSEERHTAASVRAETSEGHLTQLNARFQRLAEEHRLTQQHAENLRQMAESQQLTIAELQAIIQEQERQMAVTNKNLADAQAHVSSLEAALQIASERQLALEAAIVDRDLLIAELHQQITAYETSTSWLLTAPLRRVGNAVRRISRMPP